MNKLFNIALIFVAAVILTACHKDDMELNPDVANDGYVRISTNVYASDMIEVGTRVVDPDGRGIHDMTLFCFDKFGLFISYASPDNVTLERDAATAGGYSLSGKITKADIPENTRRIHFVANQNMAPFKETDFVGLHEQDVMTKLQGSSGMMIYWGRYVASDAIDSGTELVDDLRGKTVKLLRNQARFTVELGAGAPSGFSVQGFTVVNTSAFGTVAAWHPAKGFDFTVEGTSSDWKTTNFLTLPDDTRRLTPPTDVDNADDTCVFETENNGGNPVSVIIKGSDGKYYRVMVVDNDDYVDIRRNHHYKVTITGTLSYGVASFAEALTAPATNNVWISISDEVNEVMNDKWQLSVDETSIVVLYEPTTGGYQFVKPYADDEYSLSGTNNKVLHVGYELTSVTSTTVKRGDAPEISWLDGNQVADATIDNDFLASGTTSDNTITVMLKDLPNGVQQQQGTLVIKKGLLQRTIKIIAIRRQEFKPMWVTTQMYGGDNNTSTAEFDGSNVTVLFTIPETCPDELLPLEVYISVDHLNLRSESGVSLPIIRNNDSRYGKDVLSHPNAQAGDAMYGKAIGYKYVYTATKKGDQRVYFRNILNQVGDSTDEDHQHSEYVTVESPCFESLSKPYVYSDDDHKRSINILNLRTYNAFDSSADEAEFINYILVPQKKGAHVEFDVQLQNDGSSMKANQSDSDGVEGFDEFLLYSEWLTHDVHSATSSDCYADFHAIAAGTYGTNTLTFGMRMHKNPTTVDGKTNIYPIQMHTDRAKSAEVVRIASNQVNSPVVWSDNAKKDASGNYTGNTYKSIIFELANYHPFRFAAQINGMGEYVHHEQEIAVKDAPQAIQLPYQPGQNVNIAFDVTDFNAIINNNASDVATDIHPFGREFKIYIDAPMLEWNTSSGVYKELKSKNKIGKESDGRFYYIVDADRDKEKSIWTSLVSSGKITAAEVTTKHNTSVTGSLKNATVQGERKVLPFKTKSNDIVNNGTITISSDENEVVFDKMVFNVTNAPISGTLKYGSTNVPQNAFVVFSLTRNNSRIGSLTVGESGQYKLVLRAEYDYNWTNDEIEITYAHTSGSTTTYYSKNFAGLNELKSNPNVTLIQE